MFYTASELQNLGQVLTKPDFIWDGVIPEHSKIVLLHGPGGVGKSAFIWSLFNAVEDGVPFLGIATKQTRTLVISTDMSVYELYLRWDGKFQPKFPMEILQPFDITHPKFNQTIEFKRVQDYVQQNDIGLVAFDTIGKIHFRDPNQEETVALVYTALIKWLPNVTIIGNFHNRKSMRDANGGEIITPDDFRGSRKWVDDAVVQLQMRRADGSSFHSRLMHGKSQVGPLIDDLGLYINSNGTVESWQDSKAKRAIQQWGDVLTSMPNAKPEELIDEYIKRFGVSRATAYRVRRQYQNKP